MTLYNFNIILIDFLFQVKRQAVAELQRAAAAERARLERLLRLPASRRAASQSPPPPDHHNVSFMIHIL